MNRNTNSVEVERLGLHLAPQALKQAQALGEELVDAVLVDGEHHVEELVVLVRQLAMRRHRRRLDDFACRCGW